MSNTPSTQQNEARYRAIFDQAGSGIMLLDLTGKFLLVNQRWCQMLGYTEAEMMQLNITDLKYPDDVASTMAYLEGMRADNPRTYVLDRRYRHKNGSEVWVTLSVSTVRDGEGRPESTMSLATEITAQKRNDAMKAFLADLAIQLAPLSTAAELTRATISAVGRYLNVHRCYFVECLPSEELIIVGENYVSDDAVSLAGTYSLFDFGGLEWWQKYSQGDLAVDNVETFPLISNSIDSYLRLDIRSYAVQPFRREGEWTTILGVTDSSPRHWSGHDMALLSDVVARVWPLIERARAEEALHVLREESDRRRRLYETIMSRTPDFVYVFDLQHHFTYANDALLQMLGKTWDEVIGKSFVEVGYEPWHAEMHSREIDQVRESRAMIRGQVPFTGTQGTRIYDYIFTPVFDADGEVESVAGTTRDVTDSVRADRLLQTQTERRELLGVAATVLLTSDDPKRMIEELYARIAPHFGIDSCYSFVVEESGESLVLQSAINVAPDVAHSVQRIQFGEGLSGTVALDRRPVVASSIQRSTDAYLATTRRIGVNSCACFPLVANGRLLATIAFASSTREAFEPDEVEFLAAVSHYAAVAYERLRLISELRNADRQKDDFIALLAHELRNPLAPIRNGLQVLRLSQDDDAIATAREMMDRQLGHMVRLIEDLLDISRITLNKLTLRRERVLLSQVIMHAVESARPAVGAAGQELLVALPSEPVYLDADLTRLAQVFSNLLTNSAKYTESAGRIQLTATVHDGNATIAVCDDGIGMPREALPGIFDMFSQIDRSIERTAGGLGIGLALVKGLVTLHGGSVTADSRGLGHGSTFTVTLPVATAPVSQAIAGDAAASRSVDRPRKRILVVDDNHDAAASMKMMLELLGNDVTTAHDGVEAVATAASLAPDLVLMDVGMPRLNGYEATRQIRSRPGTEKMMIVALTGWGQESDRTQSREAGCNYHLVKPVSMESLQELLQELADVG